MAAEVGRPQGRERLLRHHPVAPLVVEAENVPPRSGRLHGDPGDARDDVRPLVDLFGIGDSCLPADHAELQAFDRADLLQNGQGPTLAVRDEGDRCGVGLRSHAGRKCAKSMGSRIEAARNGMRLVTASDTPTYASAPRTGTSS